MLNVFFEKDKKEKLEYICLCISLVLFLLLQIAIVPHVKNIYPQKAEAISSTVIFLFFGITHILARNVLANLYNTQKTIIPFAPTATPKVNLLIGFGTIVLALIIIILNV